MAFYPELGPIMAIDNDPLRWSVISLGIVDARANLLDTEELVDQVELDKYSFIRDAYLQRRSALVRRYKAKTGSGSSLPDYSEPSLPDYTDPDLPDSSGVGPITLSQRLVSTRYAPATNRPPSTSIGDPHPKPT